MKLSFVYTIQLLWQLYLPFHPYFVRGKKHIREHYYFFALQSLILYMICMFVQQMKELERSLKAQQMISTMLKDHLQVGGVFIYFIYNIE